MVLDNNRAAYLRAGAEKVKNGSLSASKLLELTKQLAEGNGDALEVKKVQKQTLLDSFAIKKFHRDYKEWSNGSIDQFIDSEVKMYNRKFAQMARLHTDVLELEGKYADLRKTISLPPFHFSTQTLQAFEGGRLLERIQKEKGRYPSKISLDQLYSVDRNSKLPPPVFAEFNKLVNLEFRLRMLRQIKHEVLLRVKSHLTAKNTQWASRDAALNLFLTRDLPKVVEEVAKTKSSEYEDLKYYEEDYDMEDSQNEEEEVVEDEEEAPEDEGDVQDDEQEKEPAAEGAYDEVPENSEDPVEPIETEVLADREQEDVETAQHTPEITQSGEETPDVELEDAAQADVLSEQSYSATPTEMTLD